MLALLRAAAAAAAGCFQGRKLLGVQGHHRQLLAAADVQYGVGSDSTTEAGGQAQQNAADSTEFATSVQTTTEQFGQTTTNIGMACIQEVQEFN